MSSNNPDEHPGQNQVSSGDGSKVGEENENSDGLKGGTGDAGKKSKKRKHDDSAEVKEISCPICKSPWEKTKAAEGLGQNRAISGGDGSKVEAKDSQDDFIESDTREIVFKVKAGQTIKLINDDDNSSFSVTKKPGVEYSITSTSTSAENKTSRISFSFTPNEISKISSSVSNLGTIQFGSPEAAGNSSPPAITAPPSFNFGNGGMGTSSTTATTHITSPPAFTFGNMGLGNSSPPAIAVPPFSSIFGNGGMGNSSSQTAPSIFAFGRGGNGGGESGFNFNNGGTYGGGGISNGGLFGGGGSDVNNVNNGSNGGIFGGGGEAGRPSTVYARGAIITRNSSTFTVNGATINGHNNTITGNGNAINGSNNRISGTNNKINGSNNHILGDTNEIFGANNIIRGLGNRATGFNNHNF